jgi:hypothetical protein
VIFPVLPSHVLKILEDRHAPLKIDEFSFDDLSCKIEGVAHCRQNAGAASRWVFVGVNRIKKKPDINTFYVAPLASSNFY